MCLTLCKSGGTDRPAFVAEGAPVALPTVMSEQQCLPRHADV